MERCGSCGRYPFCLYTTGASGKCNMWIAKETDYKQGVKNG